MAISIKMSSHFNIHFNLTIFFQEKKFIKRECKGQTKLSVLTLQQFFFWCGQSRKYLLLTLLYCWMWNA